jgi:hypothetical protein
VNIKVVAVETFPGPQGGAFKRTLEGGQITQFDEGLAFKSLLLAVQSL